jgi:glycosyltransferase involved in cell wall biosynthesis
MRVGINAWFWNRPMTGTGQYSRRLVEHLAALAPGPEVVLVAPEESIPSSQEPTTGVRTRLTSGRGLLPRNLHKVVFEQVTFPRACRRPVVDVAHVPYWAPPIAPPVPAVVTIHDLIPVVLREYRGGPMVRLYAALVSRTARSATLVLTDSEASKRDVIRHLGLPEGRVRVVPLAADGHFSPASGPNDTAIRARYDLPAQYMLYLGSFDVRKNIATLLDAYCWAGPAIGGECPLVLAGLLPARDTPFTPDPRRMAGERGIDPRFVRFVGAVDEADKPAFYRGAVAFVYPSRYEGFGLPPLEAMACGVPVVGSNTSSIPEVVADAGVLLPPDDARGMADALIQLASDGDARAELSGRALKQAARYSWQRSARETLAAYESVVA